jgi:hypothetical protein
VGQVGQVGQVAGGRWQGCHVGREGQVARAEGALTVHQVNVRHVRRLAFILIKNAGLIKSATIYHRTVESLEVTNDLWATSGGQC